MAQRLTIKQIADLAGVSVGTVDRVLHNRGMVSEAAMKAISAVLKDQKYDYNLHTSAVAFKKTKKVFDIIISIPSSEKGEYWDLIKDGIEHGLAEYSDIPIKSRFVFFDQFDSFSCKEAFNRIAEDNFSAAILGTTFADETRELCRTLDNRHIPYIFVDGHIENTSPVATFSANQDTCGQTLAHLIGMLSPTGSEIGILLPRRKGTQMSTNSKIRLEAFKNYFKDSGNGIVLKEAIFSADSSEKTTEDISDFLKRNPEVKALAVVISNGYLIADALSKCGRSDICVGGFDITERNVRSIRDGGIDFLINQHPDIQGFQAVEAALHFLLYGAIGTDIQKNIPVDIILKENLPQ